MSNNEITSKEYSEIAEAALNLSKNELMGDLYESIGDSLYDNGYCVEPETLSIISVEDPNPTLSSYRFIRKTNPLARRRAKRNGRIFFEEIRKMIIEELCSNALIYNAIIKKDKNLIKKAIESLVKLIITVIQKRVVASALHTRTLVAVIIALILKNRYEKVCSAYWNQYGTPVNE